ncbi:MAG: type II toxin-antitoxin system RelE/ParE family toxin [Burkholderiaceae bacterium]
MTKLVYKIEWQPRAREDLRTIVRYIGKDSPTIARSFAQQLQSKTLPLTRHPELGRIGRPGLPNYVRELVVHQNHLVFYRVLHDLHTVEILRVKHMAQQTP